MFYTGKNAKINLNLTSFCQAMESAFPALKTLKGTFFRDLGNKGI
jgi:hypothetical protein